MNNISDWLNRANYTAEQRRHMCVQLLSEAQYWDSTQYQKMMHDSTKRPWVGLTDEEIQTTLSQLYCDINQMKFASNNRPQKETVGFLFAKAIEAKLKDRT
jgi:hypothetical protein